MLKIIKGNALNAVLDKIAYEHWPRQGLGLANIVKKNKPYWKIQVPFMILCLAWRSVVSGVFLRD